MSSDDVSLAVTGRLPGWKRGLPVGFVVGSLIALGLLPLFTNQHASSIRREISEVAEPARGLSNRIQVALLREQALIVAFQATEQVHYRDAIRQVIAARGEAFRDLAPLVRRISPGATGEFRKLQSCTERWQTSIEQAELISRDLPPPLFLQRLFDRQPVYEQCQSTAENLKNIIRADIDYQTNRLAEIDRTGMNLTLALTLLALAAAGMVIWLGRQTRLLAEAAEQERLAAERQAERAEVARAEAEAGERRTAFLSEVGRELSASLDLQSMLSGLARLLVPTLGEICLIDLLDDGSVSRLATVAADPGREDDIRRTGLLEGAPEGSVLGEALTSGNPQMIPHFRSDELPGLIPHEPSRSAAVAVGLRSLMVVPLRSREKTLGAITLGRTLNRRSYDGEDLELAMRVAARAGLAVDNANLYLESQQAVRAREEILAVVSHDLRNPLTTIQMTSSLLLEDGPEEFREDLELIRTTARRMNRLIQDLLDVSTMERGRPVSIQLERIEVASLLREACEMFRSRASAESKRLDLSLPETPVEIEADRDRILQVFSNLIGNAMKFTGSGDRITLGARGANGRIEFSVADSGPGIPAHDVDHVFEPFWQARRTARLGAGLGLTISRGIVEAHGGTIHAESREGEGTTFLFTIPV